MARDRRHEVKRVLMVALTINVAMTLLKMVVGLASGSLAVVADAMHSATDALSSLTGLITNGLSDPKPDRDHPYGHHKYEGIGALAVAGFIFFTAIEILITSSERLTEGLPELRINATELLLLAPGARLQSFARQLRATRGAPIKQSAAPSRCPSHHE